MARKQQVNPAAGQNGPQAAQEGQDSTIGTIGDLIHDPVNRRLHGGRNRDMMADSLRTVGAARSIVVDEDNTILAGNGVTQAAADAGITKVRFVDASGDELIAVRRSGLTPDQKRNLALFDNRTAELAAWNIDQLAADLKNGEDLSAFFLADELASLLDDAGPKPGKTDPDAVPPQRPTDICPGDIFELGAHRLICGDCTNNDDVARLLADDRADAGFTSPPYNAGEGFSGGYNDSPDGRTDRQAFYHRPAVDARTSAEYVAFLLSALATAARHLKPTAPLLWNTCYNAKSRDEYGRVVFSPANPLTVRETIIWDKGKGMNISTSGILSRTCEFVFLLCQSPDYYTNQGQYDTWWNVWRISNHSGGNQEWGHGASFPIGVADEAITRFSPSHGVVYEPFAGSGTVIVSCEQHGRRGRAVEIEPSYCQIIVDRWEAFTGRKAAKVGEAVRG